MRHLTIAAILALVFTVGAPGLGAQSGYDLFQKALATERADGNLREAIQLYERVATQFATDRPLVARALVRIADCYEKLGQRDAMKVYERIVRDFSDQAESVQLARARLNALQSAPRTQLAQSVRQLWSGISVDPMGTASADGRYLSFTDWETGDLAVRDVAEDTSRRLTNTGGWQASGDYAEFSVMSPDGRHIAYAWFTDKGHQPSASRCQCRYDLRVVATGRDASKPKVVLQTKDSTEWLRPAAWMPDGKQLVVVRTLHGRDHQLALLTLADNSLRILKSFERSGPDTVGVSPDGRFLVYDAASGGEGASRDIHVLTVDGGRETPVVQAAGHDRSAVWSADGGHVLFISDRTGTESLWRVPMRDGTASGPAVIVSAISGNSRLIGTTRSGGVLYWRGGESSNVYVATVDSNVTATGPPTIAIDRFVNSNYAPSWSPDGTRLAYLSRRGASPIFGGAGPLVVHSVATGESRDVPTQIPVADQASWFPDGRSVLVASREPAGAGRYSFYRVDVTTGDAQVLLRSKGFGLAGRRPQVSPDGQTIVYVDRGVGSDADPRVARLMRFDIASGQETELKKIDGNGALTSFAISPDGADVAYLRFDTAGRSSILEVMPQRGGESRELFRENNNTGSRNAWLGWTPDKRYIIVTRTTATAPAWRTTIWKVPVAGGAAEETGISAPGEIRFPSLHPQGGRIAFAGTGGGSEPAIWMIENFLPRTR